MTGKELIHKTFQLNKTERIPWVPFVGCHGAYLTGKTAEEYLKSRGNIVQGVGEAISRYNPDGLPVAFDLQIEAEAMGCTLGWSENNPPAVISHPLSEGISLSKLNVPSPDQARIGMIMEAAGRIRQNHKDIALYALITGPFTLGLHLLGTSIFMKMLEDEQYIHDLLEFTKEVALRMTDYYLDAGCDVIALVDPMTSQIGPDQFAEFISAPATDIFEYIRSKNALSSFFVCGYAQQNIEEMCKCKPDNVSVDENIPLDFVRDTALKHEISFGGNLKLTVVLLTGTPEDCMTEAMDAMETGGKKGFILAPGCDLPMSTPPENIEAITKLVHDPYQQDVIRALDRKSKEIETINMKEYGKTDKVIVDVITLDSESCAPCQYMVESVRNIAPYFEGIVEWREHAIKKMESVTFMNSLMVKNIPTICIDGKIAFVSKIPPENELVAAIQKRINEKFKYRIKSRRGRVLIFGKDRKECSELKNNLETAFQELGTELETVISTSKKEMGKYGILQTPAVLVEERKVKTQGTVPTVDVFREWIKEIVG